MSPSTRILLLGARGFVGSNLRTRLGRRPDYAIHAPSHDELDALDEAAIVSVLRETSYDVVLNCLDRHAATDSAYAEQRLRMYFNLAAHSDLFGKMIWFGSGAEYGRQLPVCSVSEGDFGRCVPADSYGFALYQMSLHTLSSLNIYNLRLFGIFGEQEDWSRRFISNCICKALYGYPLTLRQDRIMDYLDVADLALLVERMIDGEPQGHTYNATSGRPVSLATIAQTVLERTQREDLPIFVARGGLSPEYTSINRAISDELGGFMPRPLVESVDRLILYYKEHLDEIDRERLLYP